MSAVTPFPPTVTVVESLETVEASTVSSDSTTVTVGGNGVTADIAPDLELETKSFMLYGIKDIPSDTKFTPYLGAGLGFSSLSTDAAASVLREENPKPAPK